jgi:hypothetical protein
MIDGRRAPSKALVSALQARVRVLEDVVEQLQGRLKAYEDVAGAESGPVPSQDEIADALSGLKVYLCLLRLPSRL